MSKYISDYFIEKKSKVIRIILLIHILCSSARVSEVLWQQQGDNISGKYFLRGKTVINSSLYGGCLKPHLLVINFFPSLMQSFFKSLCIYKWCLSFSLWGTSILSLFEQKRKRNKGMEGTSPVLSPGQRQSQERKNPEFLVCFCVSLADEQKYVKLEKSPAVIGTVCCYYSHALTPFK